MPRRIQMTRRRPWRRDHPDAVIVARQSKWGNPFRVGISVGCGVGRDFQVHAVVTPAAAVSFFQAMLEIDRRNYPGMEEIRTELRGRDLACWCPLDRPCHADVLLEIANR